jgi:hypothetical protein
MQVTWVNGRGAALHAILGEDYDLIGFDPRYNSFSTCPSSSESSLAVVSGSRSPTSSYSLTPPRRRPGTCDTMRRSRP